MELLAVILTLQDREEFRERGLLHFKRLIPTSKTKVVKEAIIAELVRLGARADGKWRKSRFPRRLRHQPQFDDVLSDDILRYMDELAGHELTPVQPHPQILLTPPQQATWSLPHVGWHQDVRTPSRDEVPGIQVFALVDDIASRGGGTVAISGSHKLHSHRGGTAVSAHHALQADPSYSGIFSPRDPDRQRFLKPQAVGGVTVQVVEMCGEAGDVYLMDMRTVHAAATNAVKKPRMAMTWRYLKVHQA